MLQKLVHTQYQLFKRAYEALPLEMPTIHRHFGSIDTEVKISQRSRTIFWVWYLKSEKGIRIYSSFSFLFSGIKCILGLVFWFSKQFFS